MEQALLDFLADPQDSAELLGLVGDRMAWSWREQGSPLPAVTLTRTDGPRDVTLGGYTGFVDGRVDVNCWGETPPQSLQVARLVIKRLRLVNAAATNGVVQGAFVDHQVGPTFEGEKPERVFRTRLSLRVPHADVLGD